MKMVKNEWKSLFKNKILMISVIAITFIPIIYASVFDKSLWDPFGSTKNLPVAVVNEDEPVTLLGQKVDVGSQVVDNLKTNHDIKWQFISKEEADKGLKDMKYYSVVTIPKDFSKSAASIMDDDPKKMEITYTTNDSYNYIAGEISEVAATELEIQVRDQVVKSYVQAIDQVATKMLGSLGEAANGSEQLAAGSGQLSSGLIEYTTGVAQAASGSGQLSQGVEQLAQGVGPLSSGVNQLDDGSRELSTALNTIDATIQPLQSNITGIDAGLVELSQAAQSMATALQNFENNLDPTTQQELSHQLAIARQELQHLVTNANDLQKLSIDASSVENQSAEIANKVNGLSSDVNGANSIIDAKIEEVIRANNELSEASKSTIIADLTGTVDSNLATIETQLTAKIADIQTNLSELSSLSAAFSKQAGEVSTIAQSMSDNTQTIAAAIDQTEAGITQLQQATNQVPASVNAQTIVLQLNQLSNVLNQAAVDIPKGLARVNQLASGSDQLTNGLDQLQAKIPTLSNGVTQLDSGALQLQSGLNELDTNSPQLLSGISQLQSGAKELADGLEAGVNESKTVKITNKTIDHFVDPTGLKNDQYSKVKNYGEALAPYIMSLALFVGCMLFNFIYPIRKASMEGQSSRSWWLSKVSIGFGASSMMALIQATVMILIGLPVHNIGLFYFTAFVSAWCYMAIVMFLAMTFDNPGRFVAMILLVLQLGGAGGTFPIQVQGQFYQFIHPYLPMSYSLYAFRNAISSGISSQLLIKSYTVLILLILLFVSLLRYSMQLLQKKHMHDVSAVNDNQKLLALETTTKEDLDKQIAANIKSEPVKEGKKDESHKKVR